MVFSRWADLELPGQPVSCSRIGLPEVYQQLLRRMAFKMFVPAGYSGTNCRCGHRNGLRSQALNNRLRRHMSQFIETRNARELARFQRTAQSRVDEACYCSRCHLASLND